MRSEYGKDTLERDELPDDPIQGIRSWIEDARNSGHPEPTAMCLSTATPEGLPSARFVLMRGLDERGLTFYTNYESQKGSELDSNPHAAATFWWPEFERQIRVTGKVVRVSSEESDAYFEGRPLKSRLAAATSPQSREIESREVLEKRFAEIEAENPNGPPRPEFWGGFRILPERIEFWQGRRARLHDRFLFERTDEGWRVARLAP